MRLTQLSAFALAILLGGVVLSAAHEDGAHQGPTITGPADKWVFPLAAPGSYALPAIRRAADASLLDDRGAPVSLAGTFDGRITVLGFIYTRCGDVCPLASARMADLQTLAAGDAEIARVLHLVSLSFDPEHDTPARMAEYAEAFRSTDAGTRGWDFLTAESEAAIRPVLAAYDQPVARKSDPERGSGPFSHLLRVFLVDGEGMIRNIYSADFLDARLVLNDVRTLLMLQTARRQGDR